MSDIPKTNSFVLRTAKFIGLDYRSNFKFSGVICNKIRLKLEV